MTKSLFFVATGFAAWIISSCNLKPDNPAILNKRLFSIDSLIDGQTKILKQLNVSVNREAGIDKEYDNVTFNPDTGFWKKEFSAFTATDIGKPALYDKYQINHSDSSGFNLINYLGIDPAMNGIIKLSIATDSSGGIVKIVIFQRENTFIYKSNRNMIMNFEHNSAFDENIIKSYHLEGYQKILLRKQVSYDINVTLDWDKES